MVSVVVPNYNHEKYLKQRISSILYQTYQDFEVIILDDCSSDQSKEIIEAFRNHPKVSKIEYNQINSGSTFKQWEKGISLSKGNHIWFAESDDWAEPEFLEKVMDVFNKNEKLGLVYCNSNMYVNDEIKTTLSKIKIDLLNNKKWENDYVNDGTFELSDSLSIFCSINNASAVVFNKEILLKANTFDLKFKYVGDWYSYLKIASISKIAYINSCLNNYREHDLNTSKNATKQMTHLIEYFLIYNWVFKNVSNLNRELVRSYFYGFVNHKVSFKAIYRKIYWKLFKINPYLFYTLIRDNLIDSNKAFIKSLIK